MDQSSNQDINKDHPVLISPLSCPNFLYLSFIKDGGVFFSDSIGNILISSTSEDIPQVHPNLPDNLLQGTLVLQDELFIASWVLDVLKEVSNGLFLYTNIIIYTHMGVNIIHLGEGFCLFFPLKLCKPTYFAFSSL